MISLDDYMDSDFLYAELSVLELHLQMIIGWWWKDRCPSHCKLNWWVDLVEVKNKFPCLIVNYPSNNFIFN